MKLELTDNFHNFMRASFPSLIKAEEAIFEVAGITLEQMRGSRRFSHLSYARFIFYHLCINDVKVSVFLSSYLNRDHSSGYHYHNNYMCEHQYDPVFLAMYDKVKEVFNSKK